MTLYEYAIARHMAQLFAKSETRVLTEKETERLSVLGPIVEGYEARETREGKPRAGRSRRV